MGFGRMRDNPQNFSAHRVASIACRLRHRSAERVVSPSPRMKREASQGGGALSILRLARGNEKAPPTRADGACGRGRRLGGRRVRFVEQRRDQRRGVSGQGSGEVERRPPGPAIFHRLPIVGKKRGLCRERARREGGNRRKTLYRLVLAVEGLCGAATGAAIGVGCRLGLERPRSPRARPRRRRAKVRYGDFDAIPAIIDFASSAGLADHRRWLRRPRRRTTSQRNPFPRPSRASPARRRPNGRPRPADRPSLRGLCLSRSR
jgi:hypothetical protein